MLKNGRPYTFECNGGIDDKLATDLDGDELFKTLEWIRKNILPSDSSYYDSTSYSLKHILEEDIGIYMTNNQFKDAMLMCGFKAVDVDELNWCFYISSESPIFLRGLLPIGERIKKLRTEYADFFSIPLSQEKFANYFGIPVSTYSKWEQGVAQPPEYVYNMMDKITWYWDCLYKHDIEDRIIYRPESSNRTPYEKFLKTDVRS